MMKWPLLTVALTWMYLLDHVSFSYPLGDGSQGPVQDAEDIIKKAIPFTHFKGGYYSSFDK